MYCQFSETRRTDAFIERRRDVVTGMSGGFDRQQAHGGMLSQPRAFMVRPNQATIIHLGNQEPTYSERIAAALLRIQTKCSGPLCPIGHNAPQAERTGRPARTQDAASEMKLP